MSSVTNGRSTQPVVSVVVPLADHRGWGLEAVESWLSQDCAPDIFQIIVVSDGRSPRLERNIRERLRPHDEVVLHPSRNEAALYNAGARVANGELMLFTESHVLARPSVVRRVVEHFTEQADDAANLGSEHISQTPFALLDELLYEQEKRAMKGLGQWRTVGLRGLVIRAARLRQFGLFTEAYDRFAETALAIHLEHAGCRIGDIPTAIVRHINFPKLRGLTPHLRSGFYGEGVFWQREPELARAFFGPVPPWTRLPVVDRTSAWLACRAIVASWWSDRGRVGWLSKVQGSLVQLPRLAAALLGKRAPARLAFWWASFWGLGLQLCVDAGQLLPARVSETFLGQYKKVREAWARCGALECLADHPLMAPELLESQELRLSDHDGRGLVGFFPREVWDGDGYHWSLPVAILRWQLSPADYRVRLNIHATGSLQRRCLRLFFNHHNLDPATVQEKDGCLWFDLRADWFAAAGDQRLILTCAPFRPRRHGLPDQRDLGVALFSIQATRLAQTLPVESVPGVPRAA